MRVRAKLGSMGPFNFRFVLSSVEQEWECRMCGEAVFLKFSSLASSLLQREILECRGVARTTLWTNALQAQPEPSKLVPQDGKAFSLADMASNLAKHLPDSLAALDMSVAHPQGQVMMRNLI